jgi:cytochrome c553
LKRITLFAATLVLVSSSASAADKKVERLWKSKCASCHGRDGKADTEKGKKMKIPDMTTAEFQKKATDEDMKKQITEGLKTEKDGVKKEMDGFKDEISGELLDAVIAHIRSLKQ